MRTSAEVAAVADQLRAYLAAHPDAKDDLTGVAEYWISGDQPQARLLRQAVEALVAEGVLEEQNTREGRTLYSRCGDCR